MNKIYRLIWNPALRTWVAVSEFAKANGKGKSGRTGLSATAVGLIGALTLSSLVSTSAYADDPVTTSTDPDSVTIGTNAETGDTTTLDANTITTGNTNVNQQELSNVAVGESAKAAMGGIALGDHADADTSTSQTPGGSVAIGAYATANKSGGATAIGLASEADGQNAVAFGAGAHANRSGDISIGYSSTSGTYTGTQISNDSEGENISLGNWSTAYGGKALAVGSHAEATAASSTALGMGSQASGVKSLSIGSDANASGENALAIGGSAAAAGESSMAIGSHASASDEQSFAVGYKAQATKADAVALGTQAKAQADRALSFGYNSSATKNDAIAMGSNSKSQGMSSLAFGTNAISADDNSVALGSNSLTAAAVGTQAITIDGKSYAFAGTAPLSTVSIGRKDAERTLTNVAAGRISKTSTDAINGSQLFAATQATEALANVAVKYDLNQDSTVNYDSITLNGDAYDSTDNSGGTTITNIARGVDDSDAVNMSQLNETNADVADVTNIVNNIAGDTSTTYTDLNGKGIRYARTNEKGLTQADAYAKGKGSSAVGYNATAIGENSLALGYNAKANNAKDVALGADSLTAAAVATTGTTLRGKAYTFAGTAPASTVSIGNVGKERTLTNLAAGRLSATSTDAVNGSQLYATNQALEDVAEQQGFAVMYDTNSGGTVNRNSVTMGGTTYNSTTKTGGTTITNVARGMNDSDAVNMSQLNETNADVADVTNIINNIAGDTSTTYTDLNGKGIRYARTNEKGLTQADAYAKGKGSSAVGYSATAIGENSLALGYNAKANNAKDVALGADSLTAAAVATTGTTLRGTAYTFAGAAPASTVSIGSVGKERTLTNLAAGRLSATSTDAVNGSQLYATNQAIEGISGDISDLSDLAVKYDTNPDGTINYNRVSMGGTTYNSTTKAGGTTLTNVAYGVNDSDAVNVQQLRDATSDMYNNGVKYFHANSTKADSVATGTDSIAVGPAAKSVGESSIAMGNAATSTGENSVAIGAGAVANNKGDVALGAGATTEQAVGTQGVTIRGNDYQFAGTTPTGTVSVGSLDNERTITNVAAGRISATSTDAVNGSQLYATNQAIEAINTNFSGLDNSVVKYVVNGDGSIDYSKIALAGDTYDQSTKTGGTTITNVAAGVNASDAVNKQQLDEVSLNVTNIAEGKDGMFQVNNTSNLPKPKPTGQNSIAGGAGAVASATNSMALGNSAKATHSNAVALGTNSVTDRDNSVSMGYAGGERQITHVAAGTAATDAVNVGQLKQSMGDSYTYTNNKFGELKEMIADQDDKLSAGIAGAMAMASLPQPYSPGASMFSMAGGTYQGESAIAMGVSTVSDNGKWVTKLSGSSNSQGDLGGSVGIGYQW
ncbi:YadA-like family protein [Leclercia sp. UBA1284]|uniref:YadA-like family protein n=1 Tax=Leclercia sp. UBA1284 TaxID=1946737 RepID=UPI00257CF0BC|nr:YadA-like family protein [Leclercia sp. UBA1284]